MSELLRETQARLNSRCLYMKKVANSQRMACFIITVLRPNDRKFATTKNSSVLDNIIQERSN